ncbi:FAR1-related sequence 5-like protein [Tanacetum coccineum]
MVVIDDHDMIDTGKGSIPRDVIDTGEGSIPTDVFDVGEGSNTRAQEEIDESDVESYRHDPDFRPSLKGTPPTLRRAGSMSIGLKAIHRTDSYKVFDFVENHNHPLMNENNMDLSRARRQLHFGDYIFIHRASLSNIGPTIAHRLKVALMSGYDKVRGISGDYRNFKRAVNLFIGDRDTQMIVDKIINRQRRVIEFSFEHHVFHDELVSMFWADETMKCNYDVFGDVVSFDATFRTYK